MKVAMLAAGVGSRLDTAPAARPKALLRFAGKSLLQRHLEILLSFGLDDITLVVGHRAAEIERELAAIGAADLVRTLLNPDYRASSLLSLWTLREVLAAGAPVLYMDADVLYDRRLLARLLDSPHTDCLLIDRDAELSEESVKVCIQGDRVVDFHKCVRASGYDYSAEWVGFARFAPTSAARLVGAIQPYVETGRTDVIYEEPIRDLILAQGGRFGLAETAGLPWIEIDFPADLERARHVIQPRLIDGPAARG
jgi:choline kinase